MNDTLYRPNDGVLRALFRQRRQTRAIKLECKGPFISLR